MYFDFCLFWLCVMLFCSMFQCICFFFILITLKLRYTFLYIPHTLLCYIIFSRSNMLWFVQFWYLSFLIIFTFQNIAPLLRTLRAQHSHLYRTNRPNSDPGRYNPQSLLIYALHNIARNLNIPSSQHSLSNPLSTVTQQYQRYQRAATICPCPPRSDTSQIPRMCDLCALLRSHMLRPSPVLANHNPCDTCNLPSNTIPTPQPCPICIVYTLLHQNTFLKRWDAITATAL